MIKRHDIIRNIDEELIFLKENFEKDQNRLRKRINKSLPFNLGAYKRTGIDLTTFILTNNNDNENFKIGILYYLELGVSHLQREFSNDSSLKIKIGEDEFEIDSTKKRNDTSLFDWWELLNALIILKNQEFEKDLIILYGKCVDEDNDPFWNQSTRLILMCLNIIEFENNIMDDILETINSGMVSYYGMNSKDLVFSKEGKEVREKIWLPIMKLYYLASQKNSKEFNNQLEAYLLFKKEWIIKNKEQENNRYWIDYPLLACCSYANDNGISISIESDYIPTSVYKISPSNI